MSEPQNETLKEMRRTIRLLERMRSLAQEATMTGALRKAGGYAAQQYNGLLGLLTRQGIIIPEYFPPLDEEASMDAVGFAAAQLAEYLRGEFPEVAADGGEGGVFENFFGKRDLSHIGDVIREAMPEWMRSGREGTPPGAHGRSSTKPEAPPEPPGQPSGEMERRLTEVAARMEAVADQMRQEGLPAEELQRHAAELARLAREQAQISQEAAGRRGRSAER
jgi:hypothetical protein